MWLHLLHSGAHYSATEYTSVIADVHNTDADALQVVPVSFWIMLALVFIFAATFSG